MSLFDRAKELMGLQSSRNAQDTELEVMYPLSYEVIKFKLWYIRQLYNRILTDCRNKSNGIKEENESIFYDSFMSTEMPQGLIGLLSKAMAEKQKIYLVYKSGVLSEANQEEQNAIDDKIKNKQKLKNEAVCDFKEFEMTKLLDVAAELMFTALQAANTGMKLSQAVLLRVKDLRSTVAQANSIEPVEQGKVLVRAVKAGKAGMQDAADDLVMPKFDIDPTNKSVSFINGFAASVIGMPLSYVNGALTTGISTTGEADEIAVDRGLKYFYRSIFKPVYEALTSDTITFRPDNWRKLAAVSNLIPVIESTDLIDESKKKELVGELFNE